MAIGGGGFAGREKRKAKPKKTKRDGSRQVIYRDFFAAKPAADRSHLYVFSEDLRRALQDLRPTELQLLLDFTTEARKQGTFDHLFRRFPFLRKFAPKDSAALAAWATVLIMVVSPLLAVLTDAEKTPIVQNNYFVVNVDEGKKKPKATGKKKVKPKSQAKSKAKPKAKTKTKKR
jgi:hypothetical protein